MGRRIEGERGKPDDKGGRERGRKKERRKRRNCWDTKEGEEKEE